MKQKIYILGLITLLLIFAGVFLKINHLAGASVLISTGIFILLFVFLPLALVNNYRKEGSRESMLLYIITWITAVVVFSSMLFKIMHWPGAGLLLMLVLPFPFVVFLPVYLYVTSKIKNYNIYNTVFILYLLVYLAVFSALLALNVSRLRIDQSMVLAKSYKAITSFAKGDQIVTSENAPAVTDPRIEEAAGQALTSIEHCRDLISKNLPSEEGNLHTKAVSTGLLDSRTLAAKVLLSDDENSPAADLELQLRNFVKALLDATGDESLAKHANSILFLTKENNAAKTWGHLRFESTYLSWALIYLESLEANVYLLKQAVVS
ncbi:MAG: hypothetical protein JW830_02210 [Bacteroidales bacterium]|nr:hypothetical protein [Bacteroidales bacterium]